MQCPLSYIIYTKLPFQNIQKRFDVRDSLHIGDSDTNPAYRPPTSNLIRFDLNASFTPRSYLCIQAYKYVFFIFFEYFVHMDGCFAMNDSDLACCYKARPRFPLL